MILARLGSTLALSLYAVLAMPGGAQAAPPMAELVQARLIAEDKAATPGRPLWVGVHLRMKEAWHTYWRNPGDTGLPTEIKWQLPEGVSAGPIVWPTPHRLPVGNLVNFGYEDEVLLLTELQVPESFGASRSLDMAADVSWLVCEKECVPGEARLTLSLPVANPSNPAGPDPGNELLFRKARQAVPMPSPWSAHITEPAAGTLSLHVAAENLDSGTLKSAFFFPATQALIDHAAAQPFKVSPDGLSIELTRNTFEPRTKASPEGVLLLTETVGGREVSQAFALGSGGPAEAAPAAVPASGAVLLKAIFFALLGGLILNLMPCVFPVLSVKVLGLVQHSGEPARRVRQHGLAYTAGVVAAFLVLAGLLLAARAAGEQVGWGFQLQSPVVVLALAYVVFAMGLSLSGLVDFGTSMVGWGGALAKRGGLSGSFFAGTLATVVATPCTAPFMGTALGFALTQPAMVALGVFIALGVGLALPFLALTLAPQLVSRLPQPGPWMQTLKQALAFPLYVTAAWLVWVLSQQVGSGALFAALLGFVALATGLWALGLAQGASGWGRRTAHATAFAAMIAALAVLGSVGQDGTRPTLAAAAVGETRDWEPFSQARLDALRAEGRPVFVNMTAAWCITCLVNERTALSTETVKAELARRGVTYLKGDWTNRDPEISRVLERHGRAGVPLYLLFAGEREPIVLPQILTPSIVLETLAQLDKPAPVTKADFEFNGSNKE